MNTVYRPDKSFGQHFLIDSHIADRIVDCAGILPEDTVLEIGPGKGILTGRLLERARQVIAVEIDRNLLEFLKEKFKGRTGFGVVAADILKVDFEVLFTGVHSRVKVVSNIPYNISTPIVELLCRNRARFAEAVLMVQREVAQRLLSGPGTKQYGLTTLNLALCAHGRTVMTVKPDVFEPPPEVMSSVISLVFSPDMRYHLESEEIFHTVTGVAFRQRRKMLKNTVIPYMISCGITETDAFNLFSSLDVDPLSRPETVGVGEFVKLSNAISVALA